MSRKDTHTFHGILFSLLVSYLKVCLSSVQAIKIFFIRSRIMKIKACISTLALLSLLVINLSNGKVLDASSGHRLKRAINWNDNWASACDFSGNDMGSVQVRGEDCGGRCAQTSGCTHFTWTTYNGGTCWLKSGSVSKSDASSTNDDSTVCGIVENSSPNSGSGSTLYNVLATRHGAHEAGACALPAASYAVTNAVALGSIDSLSHLKFKPELCGQVLRVDCGNGPLNIIITNSNYGGGLDLYGSTWDRLTANKPPGETSCSVQLTSQNAFNFDGPRCYYKPGTDYGNAYYHNVGLLNTSGRKVVRATIDNRAGEHRGDNPYYAFDFGPIDDNKQVIFTLDDGNTQSVSLRDCQYQGSEQMWS